MIRLPPAVGPAVGLRPTARQGGVVDLQEALAKVAELKGKMNG